MKIVDVRTIPLSYRCEKPYMSAAGGQVARNALLVEVETDTGLVGLGEAGSAGGPLASTQVVVSTQTNLREMLAMHDQCVVSLEEDLARVEAVRRVLGREAKLMVDINCAWSPALAIQMGRAMEPQNLYWIEEPVATDDIKGSAEVARALGTAIAGYETESGAYGFRELITQRAVDIIQPDIARAGGFTECRRIAAFAHVYNMMVAPHAFSSAITLVASMHLLASLPNGLLLEFDQNPNALRAELLQEPISAADGFVKMPERPGLGVALEPAVIERYRV